MQLDETRLHDILGKRRSKPEKAFRGETIIAVCFAEQRNFLAQPMKAA